MESDWLLVLASVALLVRVGQTLGAIGLSRAKSAASAGMRSLADLCIATLCFWAVGAAIALQTRNSFFWISPRDLIGWSGVQPEWFKILVTILIATSIVGPAVAERSRLAVPLAMGAILAALIVPMVGQWTGAGWLYHRHFNDLAWAAAAQLAPAVCAVVAVIFVGPREGKYNHDGSSNMIPGHSVPMVLLGTMLTIVGWVGYVLMWTPPQWRDTQIAANVFVAAAAGGLANLIVSKIRYGKVDIFFACSGVVGGLVSITAAAASVGTPAAFLIGFVAGLVVPWAMILLDVKCKLDDPGGVIAIHGVGAVWALVAAAIFAADKTPAERLGVLAVHLAGIVVIVLASAALSAGVMYVLKLKNAVRTRDVHEFDGLDLAEHDINAHPDFQQTMIKSYHLREA